MIEEEISKLIYKSVSRAQTAGEFTIFEIPKIKIDTSQISGHGDYSSNIAMQLKSLVNKNPIEIAETIITNITTTTIIDEIVLAKPGFINFYLNKSWLSQQIKTINSSSSYGNNNTCNNNKMLIEYVSANPTGPVHIGNGRGASIGSSLAKVLRKCNFMIEEEFYINDTGNQISLFGQTLYARYSQLNGKEIKIPENGYRGAYMIDLAKLIKHKYKDSSIFIEENNNQNQELTALGLSIMIDDMKNELKGIGVEFTNWFYESDLHKRKTIAAIIKKLSTNNFIEKKENALWFQSSKLGDSKDNVLLRTDGTPTYFSADIAYHYNKLVERKFDKIINIWGADHQGHVSRLKKAIEAIGIDQNRIEILLYQLITLKRGEKIVPLSKRAGEIISLKEIFTETGKDAMRFFFLSQSANQAMEFDLELAKKQTKDNPVYYVQYAHARICAVLKKATEEKITSSHENLSTIQEESELALIKKLIYFPQLITKVAEELAPHHLPHYSIELAHAFHHFYTNCKVIDIKNKKLSEARLALLEACKIVLASTLDLIGVEAPEKM
jgi:arginyl-tRNA synthetase